MLPKRQTSGPCWPGTSQKTLLLSPFSVHNFQKIQGVVSVRGVSLISVEEWCGHTCFYDLICESWLFCASRWRPCEVMSCNNFCLYYSYISIFDKWPAEVYLHRYQKTGEVVFSCMPVERVQYIASCSARFASYPQIPGQVKTKILAHAVAFTRLMRTQRWQVFKCICFKCCVCGKESECKVQTKIIVLYRKRYMGFLFWNVTQCCLLYIFCI